MNKEEKIFKIYNIKNIIDQYENDLKKDHIKNKNHLIYSIDNYKNILNDLEKSIKKYSFSIEEKERIIKKYLIDKEINRKYL